MANREDIGNSIITTGKLNFNINCSFDEWRRFKELEDRRMYLYGSIVALDEELCGDVDASMTSRIIENIITINCLDKGLEPEDRVPIMLYIDSPGGDVNEGFALISAIEASKTPIYTVNIGQWSSMAFWIGITGHKRYSLPYVTFLMHDGSSFAFGTVNKVQDQMEFTKRFETKVIKNHVLSHSNMTSKEYNSLLRKEFYMLPDDAKKYNFIDEIITDLDDIL